MYVFLVRIYSVPEKHQRGDFKDDEESLKTEQDNQILKSNNALYDRNEPNKNIVSRLADLNADTDRNLQEIKKKRSIEVDNNNTEEDVWLSDAEDILNQNQQKSKDIRKLMFDNTKLEWDLENNSNRKHFSGSEFKKLRKKKEAKVNDERSLSPSNISQYLEILDTDLYTSKPTLDDNFVHETIKSVDSQIVDESRNENSTDKSPRAHKSKLMPEMDLQKVINVYYLDIYLFNCINAFQSCLGRYLINQNYK